MTISINVSSSQSIYPIISYTEEGKVWIYSDNLNNKIIKAINKASLVDTFYLEIVKRDNVITACDSLKNNYRKLYDMQHDISVNLTNSFSVLKDRYSQQVVRNTDLQLTLDRTTKKKDKYKKLFFITTTIITGFVVLQFL